MKATTYTTYQAEVKGNIFEVMNVSGYFNYVNVTKVTNNPHRGLGKQFANFDEACMAYKSGDMKSFLLQVEMGLIPVKSQIQHNH